DRDRLGIHLGQRIEVELDEDAVGAGPLTDAEAALERNERLRMRLAEPVEARARLAAEVEDVLEALGRDERRPGSRPLEERVRRDRRPVREPLQLVRAEDARTLELTFALDGGARSVRVAPGRRGYAAVEPIGDPLGRDRERILATVAHVLRLDEDLSEFYALAASDPQLDWVGAGAGRMLRSPTVFEDVTKTICTTNCAWSATVRMVGALVERLGPEDRATGRHAFPSPAAMAGADESF